MPPTLYNRSRAQVSRFSGDPHSPGGGRKGVKLKFDPLSTTTTHLGHLHVAHGLTRSLVVGGNQAARLGLILGLQAFAMPGATLLGVEHPVRTPVKAELVLHLRVSSCAEILANPGRRAVTSSRRDDVS
jgi:hypothetical protein